MKIILVKATLAAAASALASLAAVALIVPAIGGVVDGNAWLMCILCPIVVAFPASTYTFWQADRLRRAHSELARAHAQLAAAHRRLGEKASRDDMTGMLNRESFFERLDRQRESAGRGALLIVDADHFKMINDRYGHLAGDEALLEIAAAIERAVRKGDFVGRIGGEEFAAFLVGAHDQEAARVAERIRREVEQILFRPEKSDAVPLTVSIGGISCAPGATVSELMRSADKQLYEAKARGRNRVRLVPGISEAA
ncbi:MAG: GGDEF domain-containing protein [Rhizobiaceae bacterium]|nr:GGDEF domain-containing protein [Rhizobiaceae bacterium]